MTSTASNYKSNFSAVFKMNFKRNIPGFAALLVISLIIPILSVIINYSHAFFGKSSVVIHSADDITFEAMTISAVMTAICGFYSIISVPEIFREIFKKQACDHFFATPVRREVTFTAKYLVGFISNIVAFALSNSFFVLVMLSMSNSTTVYKIEAQPYLLTAAATLLAVLAVYSVFVVCAVTSGKRFQYIVFSAVSLLCVSGIISATVLNLNKIWGNFIEIKYLSAISSVENAINSFIYISDDNFKPVYIFMAISLAEITAAFAVGFLIFKKRKAEAAEVSPSDKIMPYIFLSILTAFSFFLHTSYQNTVLSVLLGAAFAAAMGMLFTGIFYKKVFTKQTAATTISVILVCTLISAIPSLPVYSKYVNNIPDASQVESVEVSCLSPDSDFAGLLNLINSGNLNYKADNTFKITSADSVKKAVGLHKSLTAEGIIKQSKRQYNISLLDYIINSNNSEFISGFNCRITYTLKSGKELKRTYLANVADSEEVVDAFAEFVRSDETFNQIKPLNIDKDKFIFAKAEGDYSDDYKAFVGFSESPVAQTFNAEISDEDPLYNKTVPIEDFDIGIFNKCYKSDFLKFDNKKLVSTLFFRNGIGFDPDFNYTPYSSSAYSVILFSIKDGTDEKICREIKALSYEEFDDLYNDFSYGSVDNPQANKLFSHIDEWSVRLSYDDVSTLNYLSSLGITVL